MRKILAIAFTASLFTACTVGDDPVNNDDGDEHPDDMNPDPNPNPTGEGLSGTLASDMTLSGAVRVKGATTIPAGVTITVAAGSTIDFVNGSNFIVQGTLKMEGTSAGKIIARAEAGSAAWNGFAVTGTLDVKYGDFIGGAIVTTGAAANLIITDTKMYKAGGDYIIMGGGTLNMTYSQIGAGPGETDSTHCNLHINAASSITVTNNNINNAPYGLMFYGGVNANFQTNNWYGANTKDVDAVGAVSGNFSNGWFEKGAPTAGAGASITATNLSATKLTNVGPRP
ncbi:MAG: hypothetical protein H0T65_22880 [Deltaproteobacteria bacterium]|nr:hypothetical protein [Deltaproteobacteria bacterium]